MGVLALRAGHSFFGGWPASAITDLVCIEASKSARILCGLQERLVFGSDAVSVAANAVIVAVICRHIYSLCFQV